jgi:hypothetical protein
MNSRNTKEFEEFKEVAGVQEFIRVHSRPFAVNLKIIANMTLIFSTIG